MGIVAPACEAVGIHRSTFYDYYNNDIEFKDAVDAVVETTIDFAESKLLENIDSNDVQSIIFYLKTKGKKRGYIEKTEVSGTVTNLNYNAELTKEEIKNISKELENDV